MSTEPRLWPRGLLAALGVVALTLALPGLMALADAAVPEPVQQTRPGKAITLSKDEEAGRVRLEPPPGWQISPTGKVSDLALRNGNASISISFAGKVDDLNTFADRRARKLSHDSPSVQTARSGTFESAGGFTGVRATAVSDGRRGELITLARNSQAITVLSLAQPGNEPNLGEVLDSLKWEE